MGDALADAIIAAFAIVIVFALFPNKTTTRLSARAANRVVGWILDGTYRVVDAIADRRAARRAARHSQPDQPDQQENRSGQQQPEPGQQQPERDPGEDAASSPPWAS